MPPKTKTRRVVEEVKIEKGHHDQVQSGFCRLCLKSDEESFTLESIFYIIEAISPGAEPPTSDEMVCQSCVYQLQSAWQLLKRIQLTDSIWKTYRNNLNNITTSDPVLQDNDEVELSCHMCSASFIYDDLLGHIEIAHGNAHLLECQFCASLLQAHGIPDLEQIADEEEVIATTTQEEEEEVPVQTPKTRNTKKIPPSVKEEKSRSCKPLHGCLQCDKTYTRRDKLKEHMTKDHPLSVLPKNTIIPPENRKTIKRERDTSPDIDGSPNKPSKRTCHNCRECKSTFEDWDKLEEHMQAVHDILEVIHSLPATNQTDQSILSPNQKPFACHECEDLSYSKYDRLVIHLRKKHKIALLKKTSKDPDRCVCKICGKVLAVVKSLWRHMEMCHGVDVAEMRRQEEDKTKAKFICPTCQWTGRTLCLFNAHLLEHNPLPFTCTHCEQVSFKTRLERKEHELNCHTLSTTSSVSYTCETCGPVHLKTMVELKAHKARVHKGVGVQMVSYRCTICHKSFPEQSSMVQHLNEHASDIRCIACSKMYFNTAQLKAHYLKSHNFKQSLICTECGQVLSRPDKLVEHMWTHTGFACNPCNMVFGSRKEAQQHRKEMHFKKARVKYDVEITVEEEGGERVVIMEEGM